MEKLIISPELGDDPVLGPKVREASELLQRRIGPSAANLDVAWRTSTDSRGRPILVLTISDWTGSVGYPFAPDELEKPHHLENRFHRLWGDFLQVRSHTQLDSSVASGA